MALRSARDALSLFFYQRCFWLFAMLLAMIAVIPFIPPTTEGRVVANWINALVLVSAVAAVGRTQLSFVIVLLLAAPALVFQWLALFEGEMQWLVHSWVFGAALYLVTTSYLLRYVFRPEVMTSDKMFGAAASFLMLGMLFGYFYALVGHFYPLSYSVQGKPSTLGSVEAIYFSMTVLTTTGFGDVAPLTRQAQAVCMIEQITGALFVAILIARLAGVYPVRRGRVE